jgi:hypothetical protein
LAEAPSINEMLLEAKLVFSPVISWASAPMPWKKYEEVLNDKKEAASHPVVPSSVKSNNPQDL